MARAAPTGGWVFKGEYFSGTAEDRRAQQKAELERVGYINPYSSASAQAIARRKKSEKIRQQQKEEQQLERLLYMRATGAGGGAGAEYIETYYVSTQQKFANLRELQKWRRLKTGYGGVGGYVAPGQYVPSAASLSFMGGAGLTTSLRYGGRPQTSISSILKEYMPDVRTTPQPSPQKIMPTYRPTPTPTAPTPTPQPAPTYGITPQPSPQQITPTPQPTSTPQISFSPTTPQAEPTYKPTPTTAYQSSYYQANGYKPYSYQQDTFGDKPFSYAYQKPRLQQSYTGI